MVLLDVNVLVYAFREDMPGHVRYKKYLEDMLNSSSAFGLCDLVCSGFLRIVTHPRIFDPPSTLDRAIAFVEVLRSASNMVLLAPGKLHWSIFMDLCRQAKAKGNLIPDAYFAALAIESGSTWVTTDRDYMRFPGLKWQHPLE